MEGENKINDTKKCLRCGRTIYSKDSIKRGYGIKCFKIIQLQKETPKEDYQNEIDFLKCEINMLKRLMKQVKYSTTSPSIDAIERIKQDEHRPERTVNKTNMTVIIKELKIIFTTEDPRSTLKKIPVDEIKKLKNFRTLEYCCEKAIASVLN